VATGHSLGCWGHRPSASVAASRSPRYFYPAGYYVCALVYMLAALGKGQLVPRDATVTRVRLA
jgi:hypothetical protein